MLDINQYSFQKEPFDQNEKFNVHPLDDEGISTYYSKDAHTHTFLDKINPREMLKIYKEKDELDKYMNTILEERQRLKDLKNNDQICENTEERVYDSQQIRQKENINFQNQNDIDDNRNTRGLDYNPYQEKQRSQTSHNFYKPNNKQGMPEYSTLDYEVNKGNRNGFTRYGNFGTFKNPPKKLDEKLASFGNSNFGKVVQPNNPLLSKIANMVKKNKSRYSVNEENCYPEENSFYQTRRKKLGFESYNIPRVIPKNKKLPVQVNAFNDKCFRSMSGFFKIAENQSEKEFDQYLNRENNRLTNILLNQTSDYFLKSNRLPKISYIVNQPEIVVKRTGNGNSKFMGGKYHAFNFNMNQYKNKVKRNDNGALFQH